MISMKTLTAAAALAVVALDTPSHAMDLTGTWAGKVKCVLRTDGMPDEKMEDDITAQITQGGNEVRMTFSGTSVGSVSAGGAAITKEGKPDSGYAAFLDCGGASSGAPNIYSFKVKTDPSDGSGKMTGTFSAASGFGTPYMFHCKVGLQRTATTDSFVSVPCSIVIP